ncbi:helix-turn-helix domain-containing protein [Saccharopolyspora pogona]|uniref:helix-turn-helix domain-containing protein n=1 Tax=Saccharopolyspora pogona TaxID=333966 RepID=UPI00168919F0|nr:helix-turn-helix transcriptional regulator [Saccharopolyspora pogona]
MSKRAQPTVRKRRLAATLRSLRDQAGVSPEQVKEELDWSRSTVSKVETANMGVSVSDVRVLCELYGTDHKITEWLVKTARDAKRRGWWASYNDAMPSIFEDYVELESEATCAHYFDLRRRYRSLHATVPLMGSRTVGELLARLGRRVKVRASLR